MSVQVTESHYDFQKYENEARFSSYYHQVKAVTELAPESLLEIGTGGGIFLSLARHMGIRAYSVDIDQNLRPGVVASVLELPFSDNSVDVCVAFQVLEHLPFEHFERALSELARVSRKGVIISLPEFGNAGIILDLPFVRKILLTLRVLPFRPNHKFDGQHYWEINKSSYSLARVMESIVNAGLHCTESWLNPYNPYHRFFTIAG